MGDNLDKRLIKAGCHSTRIRVLAVDHPDEFVDLVARIEAASKKASGDTMKERAFDAICEGSYLSDEESDKEALSRLTNDLAELERKIN